MNSAVIDIGTNTLILLIAEVQPKGKIKVLHDEAVITRLGQGLINNHFFLSEAMQRTFAVLSRFKKICDEHGVKNIAVIGTAAFRNAANSPVFIEKVENECGWKIDVISGEDEAKYTFHAAWRDFGSKKKRLIVVDIGGGSTEIITGPLSDNKPGPQTVISLQLGTVRLTELYAQSDPISEADLQRLHKTIINGLKDELDDFYPKGFIPTESILVATAGTATTLAAMHEQMTTYDPARVHGMTMKKKELEEIINRLTPKSLKDRQKLPGLEPLRADVILAGALLLNEMMNYFKQKKVVISDRGLRYGVFYQKFSGAGEGNRTLTLSLGS